MTKSGTSDLPFTCVLVIRIRHCGQYISQLVIWIQICLGTLLLSSIPIVHERSEDRNNKDQDLKANIYHLALTTMLQCKCPF